MRVHIPNAVPHVDSALERVHSRDVQAAALGCKMTRALFASRTTSAFRNSMGKGIQTELHASNSVLVVRTYQDLKSEVIQASAQWDGYDLDGTLAEGSGKFTPGVIGKPIKPMIRLLKMAIRRGDNPRIFTARTGAGEHKAIDEFLIKNVGQTLPITNKKDEYMRKLYDDRAVPVKRNQGVVGN